MGKETGPPTGGDKGKEKPLGERGRRDPSKNLFGETGFNRILGIGESGKESAGSVAPRRIHKIEGAGTVTRGHTELSFHRIEPGEHSAALELSTRDSFPISIFLAKGESQTVEAVKMAVKNILDRFDFDLITDTDPHRGSWWQNFQGKAASKLSPDAVLERLEKLEDAADIKLLRLPQSQANLQNAQAIAALITALDGESAAAIHIGPLLLVKGPGSNGQRSVAAKMLSTLQLMALEQHPELLRDPISILSRLSELTEANDVNETNSQAISHTHSSYQP